MVRCIVSVTTTDRLLPNILTADPVKAAALFGRLLCLTTTLMFWASAMSSGMPFRWMAKLVRMLMPRLTFTIILYVLMFCRNIPML